MKHTALGLLMATVAGILLILGVGAATARGGFSMHSLKGGYASTFSGEVSAGGGTFAPIMGTGLFIADGRGHLTGHETYTVDTTVCDASISGSYTINPDGTGTDSITFTPPGSETGCQGGSYTQSLAIGENRKLVLLSNTNGDEINEEWHRQR